MMWLGQFVMMWLGPQKLGACWEGEVSVSMFEGHWGCRGNESMCHKKTKEIILEFRTYNNIQQQMPIDGKVTEVVIIINAKISWNYNTDAICKKDLQILPFNTGYTAHKKHRKGRIHTYLYVFTFLRRMTKSGAGH